MTTRTAVTKGGTQHVSIKLTVSSDGVLWTLTMLRTGDNGATWKPDPNTREEFRLPLSYELHRRVGDYLHKYHSTWIHWQVYMAMIALFRNHQ